MTLPAYLAFFVVGGVLVVFGLLVLLATPPAGGLILLIGAAHVLLGLFLRGRANRRATATR
jgi:hypothetical protein